MPKFCPRCNTQAYDDTSFFCYKCGTQLPALIVEKMERKRPVSQISSPVVSLKKRIGTSIDASPSMKSISFHRIEPVEICANCGVPIYDKSRIFCADCGAYVREDLTENRPSELKYSVAEPFPKIKGGSQTFSCTTINQQESVLKKGMNINIAVNQPNPKSREWKSIIILAGIAISFFIIMLMLLIIFP
jgi:ribosomal protein L37E